MRPGDGFLLFPAAVIVVIVLMLGVREARQLINLRNKIARSTLTATGSVIGHYSQGKGKSYRHCSLARFNVDGRNIDLQAYGDWPLKRQLTLIYEPGSPPEKGTIREELHYGAFYFMMSFYAFILFFFLFAVYMEVRPRKTPTYRLWFRVSRQHVQFHLSTAIVLVVTASVLLGIEVRQLQPIWGWSDALAELLSFLLSLAVALPLIGFFCEFFLWPTHAATCALKNSEYWFGPQMRRLTDSRFLYDLGRDPGRLLFVVISFALGLWMRWTIRPERIGFTLLFFLLGAALILGREGIVVDKARGDLRRWWGSGIRFHGRRHLLREFTAIVVTAAGWWHKGVHHFRYDVKLTGPDQKPFEVCGSSNFYLSRKIATELGAVLGLTTVIPAEVSLEERGEWWWDPHDSIRWTVRPQHWDEISENLRPILALELSEHNRVESMAINSPTNIATILMRSRLSTELIQNELNIPSNDVQGFTAIARRYGKVAGFRCVRTSQTIVGPWSE